MNINKLNKVLGEAVELLCNENSINESSYLKHEMQRLSKGYRDIYFQLIDSDGKYTNYMMFNKNSYASLLAKFNGTKIPNTYSGKQVSSLNNNGNLKITVTDFGGPEVSRKTLDRSLMNEISLLMNKINKYLKVGVNKKK